MKVVHSEKHVLGSAGLQETKSFEIRASAHAFKILSSGLYSDKVTAVLREIGCNAYDAHVEGGCPGKPFEVKLPNSIDPQFYIRDFGPGLTHQGVMNLYTTYFASTKQDSNDYTGAFGLGSKSPFSYTDSFTVTACRDGRKRVYTAHIDNKTGAPVVALMGETDADPDWPHGLEIGFPVKPADFAEFATKAAAVYCGFKTLPKIIGGQPIRPLQLSADYGSYAFLKEQTGIHASMGNVLYPIAASKIQQDAGARDPFLAAGLSMGRQSGILLRFDIGDLQVAASREELQYDPQTQAHLRERLSTAVKDTMADLKSTFGKIRTWKDMCEFQRTKQTVTRGISITSELLEAANIDKNIVSLYESYHYKFPEVYFSDTIFCIVSADGGKVRVNYPSNVTGSEFMPYTENVTIMSGDAKNPLRRVKQAFKAGALTGTVLLVYPRDRLPRAGMDAAAKKLEKAFVGVPHLDVGSFPEPVRPKVKRKKGVLASPQLTVDLDGVSTAFDKVPADRRVYIPIIHRLRHGIRYAQNYLLDEKRSLEPYEWNKLMSLTRSVANAIPTFKFLKPIEFGKFDMKRCKFDMRPDWKHYRDYIEEQLSDKDNLNTLAKLVEGHKPIVNLNTESSHEDKPFENLVALKEYQPKIFTALEPLLKKHGILDEVNAVHRRSKVMKLSGKWYDASVEPAVLTGYKQLADALGVKIDAPKFKAATLSLNNRFLTKHEINYETMVKVGNFSTQALEVLLEKLIV